MLDSQLIRCAVTGAHHEFAWRVRLLTYLTNQFFHPNCNISHSYAFKHRPENKEFRGLKAISVHFKYRLFNMQLFVRLAARKINQLSLLTAFNLCVSVSLTL